eukprot:UN00936
MNFLIHDPDIVGGFICYLRLKTIFRKVRNPIIVLTHFSAHFLGMYVDFLVFYESTRQISTKWN